MKRVSWCRDVQSQSRQYDTNQVLTSIPTKKIPGVKGNVHTGATPPWLRDDDHDTLTDSQSPLIGPSLSDFILHREQKKRAAKNPKRVGADFHIKLATQKQPESDEWLPAFGRVWNHGPRVHSKQEFLQELNKEHEIKSAILDPLSMPVNQTHTKRPRLDNRTPHQQAESGLQDHTRSSSLLSSQLTTRESDLNKLMNHGESGSSSSAQASEDIPSLTVKPYRRKRVWDTDSQKYIIK